MPKRSYTKLTDFVEDMYVLRSAGYTTKQEYIDRLNITKVCFDQRMARARRQGLLPKPQNGRQEFDPFNDLPAYWTKDGAKTISRGRPKRPKITLDNYDNR